MIRWALGEEDYVRFGEWLLRSPFGPPLRRMVGWLDRLVRWAA